MARPEPFQSNPFDHFRIWFRRATMRRDIRHPEAACLSTVSRGGVPEGRVVLLKRAGTDGFVFFTNTLSAKGRALSRRPVAALTFFWEALERQVRLQGKVSPVDRREADVYFQTRPRASQLGAWASRQSEFLPDRKTLERRFLRFQKKFRGGPVPRPPDWSGYRLVPDRAEFWIARPRRLHDRLVYIKKGRARWKKARLYP
jgi:pyridoxamine 5'-phosphate oxidase